MNPVIVLCNYIRINCLLDNKGIYVSKILSNFCKVYTFLIECLRVLVAVTLEDNWI